MSRTSGCGSTGSSSSRAMEVCRVRLASGVELDCDVAGPEEGRLVLLLHKFPECRHGWRHQLLELAAAGYRVVAPDQRG